MSPTAIPPPPAASTSSMSSAGLASTQPSTRAAALLAAGAALLYAALLAIIHTTHVDPQWFERVQLPAVYADALRGQAGTLRLILAVDTVFIACYAGATIALAPSLRGHAGPMWATLLAGLGVVAGGLDLVENQHILAMLVGAEHGGLPSAGELDFQMTASACKWLVGHIAFAWMAALLAPARGPRRLAVLAVGGTQLVIGAGAWMAPTAWLTALGVARAVSLLSGFVLIAAGARALARSAGSGSGAPA